MAIFLSDALAPRPTAERGFLSVGEIKEFISTSKNYRADSSDPNNAGALLLFSTPRQQTWLVATRNRLYCILDDVRNPAPNINWSMGRAALVGDDGKLRIDIVERPNTERSGLIDIGPNHRDWLFSKSLFTTRPAEIEVRDFILKQMSA